MGPLKSLRSVRISSYKEIFGHLYGFTLSSGSILSDNHNGAIETFDSHSDKYGVPYVTKLSIFPA